jgi:protein TonB
MIWSSRVGKLGVVLASVGAHGLAAYMFWGDPEIRIEGGSEASVQARLGNSFSDMAAGTLVPETPDTLHEVDPTEVAELISPRSPIEQTDPDQLTEATQPEETQRADAEAADRLTSQVTVEVTQPDTTTETIAAVPTRQADPELTGVETRTEQLTAPALPTDATPPATALALDSAVTTPSLADLAAPVSTTPLEPLTPAPTVTQPQSIEAVQPQQTVIATAPPPETLQALPEDGVQVSPRPQLRPQRIELETEHRRAQKQQPTRRVQQGNAQQNTVAGSETGSNQTATTGQSTNTGSNSAVGNAAVSNYPGRVMRCISRAGRPRVSSSGTAVVAFSIAANGRVSQVQLARSSGNAGLDRAAIQTISRAGPCSAPPAGAQRSFHISIEGRG